MNRWAVVGNGFIAPRHIQAIKEIGDELVAIVDIDTSKEINGVPFFIDYKDVPDEVTHVAICTPNYLHFEIAKHFADLGKVVLCEKPLVLNSKQLYGLPKNKVFTVLQLRYHPEVLRVKENFKPKNGELTVKVKRDQTYWEGWKGDEKRSGGILFNLGVHYFDLLFFLFGNDYRVIDSEYEKTTATGTINFSGHSIKYEFKIMPTNDDQQRKLIIGNEVINLSNKDNLSFEDLHTEVYRNLLSGNGIGIEEAGRAIKLIEFLK